MHIDIEKQWKNERKSKYITSYEHNTKEWKRKEKKKVQDPELITDQGLKRIIHMRTIAGSP